MTSQHYNKPQVVFTRIGKTHSYQEVWDLQTHLHRKVIKAKRSGVSDHPGYLLLCEHPPVYTLGKSGSMNHLRRSEEELSKEGMSFFKINRGGDITYHGPGQITGYLIMDLDQWYHDLHRFVRDIEEVIIKTMSLYNLKGSRIHGLTGVWLKPEDQIRNDGILRKICAIGIHMSRWVSMHGFAFNVFPNLDHFKNIIPCGIDDKDKTVTSLTEQISQEIELWQVADQIAKSFSEVFDAEIIGS